MSLLRSLLFDNLGLKLVALLLSVLVYLNVYTDRPATQIVSFPLQITDLPDSLALAGPIPAAVQAELRGTGKQLIRMRITEPPFKLSLAGVGVGRYERALSAADLPLPASDAIQVERIVSPRTVELQVDRRVTRRLPVAARVTGVPSSGVFWGGGIRLEPRVLEVTGPEGALAALDSVRLAPVVIAGRRDTVRVSAAPEGIPEWSTTIPEQVMVTVPLEPAATRRITLPIQPPRGAEGFSVVPDHVTLTISAPRAALASASLAAVRIHWTAPLPVEEFVGRRVALRRTGSLPEGARVRMEPDSVTLQRP
jgi:hypothetical protein